MPGKNSRRSISAISAAVLLTLILSTASAQLRQQPSVAVSYSTGDTEIDSISLGAKFFLGLDHQVGRMPAELSGCQFTRRAMNVDSAVTIAAPAGVTVHLLLGCAGPAARPHEAALSFGWKPGKDGLQLVLSGKDDSSLCLFSKTFTQPERLTIPGGGFAGVVVLSPHLVLRANASVASTVAKETPAPCAQVAQDDSPVGGPVLPIKRQQSEIKALYVQMEESGEMLGLASQLILTATPGSSQGYTPVRFVSQVGDQMTAVLDDVLRAIHVDYPKWGASKVELSFEDRYTPKDGGSIGAAIGTLIMSMLQGFEIDDKVAITGDVTADTRLRRIGGVAAKIRGATAAGCNLVILPTDNYDQLVDAMVYEGPLLITDVQVVGASNLKDATALARVDRDEKLSQALDAFGSLAAILKKSPDRVHTKGVQEKLQRVLTLAPNHFSAKLLLLVAQNQQPRRVSAGASMYYMAVAVQQALPDIFESGDKKPQATPKVVQAGLVNLRKLRGKADSKVLPAIDSMIDFIQTLSAVNIGRRRPQELESKRQKLLDALSKMQTDRALMEKMLHEGI